MAMDGNKTKKSSLEPGPQQVGGTDIMWGSINEHTQLEGGCGAGLWHLANTAALTHQGH
jgi:hypothetical protein